MSFENPRRRDVVQMLAALSAAVAVPPLAFSQEADYQDVHDRTIDLQEEIRHRTEAISEYWVNYIETKREEAMDLMKTYLREWVEGVYEQDYLEKWEEEIGAFILEENPMIIRGASMEDFELEYIQRLEAIAVRNRALVRVMNRILQDAENPFLGEATQTLHAKLERILGIQDPDQKVEKLQRLEEELWRQVKYERKQELMRDWLYVSALIDEELRAAQSPQSGTTAAPSADINDDLEQAGTASRGGPTPFIYGHETGGITADETYYENPDAQMGIGQQNAYHALFNALILHEIERRLQPRVENYDSHCDRFSRGTLSYPPAFHGQETNIQGIVYRFLGPNEVERVDYGRIIQDVRSGAFHMWYNKQLGNILPRHVQLALARELGEEPPHGLSDADELSQLTNLHPVSQMVVLAWLKTYRRPLSVDWQIQLDTMSPEQITFLQGFETFRRVIEIPSVRVMERYYAGDPYTQKTVSLSPMPKGEDVYDDEVEELGNAMSEHGYFLLASGRISEGVLNYSIRGNRTSVYYAYSNLPDEDGRLLTHQEILNHWAQVDIRRALLPLASGVAVGLRYLDLERLLEEPPVVEFPEPEPRYNLVPFTLSPLPEETELPRRELPSFESPESSRAGGFRFELVPEEDDE